MKENKVLMLQKPRRGWWVAPGGKMESGETIKDTVVREFREETGIYLKNPTVKGVFTILIKEQDQVVDEWMMFTFFATDFDGDNLEESEEGKLKWQEIEAIPDLPMAEGDHHIIDYVLRGTGVIYGTFTYTPDYELIAYRLDPS